MKGFPLGSKWGDSWERGWYPKIGTVIKTMKTRVRLKFADEFGHLHIKTYDQWHAKRFLKRLDK